jgi:predicted permease
MIHLFPDLRYAFRGFFRNPLFTMVAVLSLALGIGANTAIFTLMDQLMLRKLPIRDPDNLMMLYRAGDSYVGTNTGPRTLSFPLYLDFKQKAEPLAEVLCRREVPTTVSVGDRTERVEAEMVSGNYFTMLGVKPAAGRLIYAEDDKGVSPVVVLSHDYWASHFGSDPNVVGSTILMSGYPMTIVGVSARGFTGLDPARSPQIRLPVSIYRNPLEDRFTTWVQVFARLKPGFTAESAHPQLQLLFHQIREHEATLPGAREWSSFQRERFLAGKIAVERAAIGYSSVRNEFSAALTVLMCMVGLVLLIACANVASLLIAKSYARRKEIAVRLSTGATHGRIVSQLLAESLALSLAGGIAGVGLAYGMTRGLLSLVPAGWNLLLRPEPDSRILLFTLVLSVLTALVFGFAPALCAIRQDLTATLKDNVGAITGAGRPSLLRKTVVTAQVALCFLLLFGAGLFARSLRNLKTADSGFRDLANLVAFQIEPAANGYDALRTVSFFQDLLERLRALPGVKSAALASVPLLRGNRSEYSGGVSVEGYHARVGEDMQAFMNFISPGYFATMGIPILEGRDFEHRDVRQDITTTIVNQEFARHYFGDRSAIGRHLEWNAPDGKVNAEIIGVVANSFWGGPREGIERQVFFRNYGGSVTFFVGTTIDSASTYAAMRNAVKTLDASMPVIDMKTLATQLDETLLIDRLSALLSAGFGLLATLLAAIGLYGVMAFAVARRTKELGVRVALGAHSVSVVWIVMKEVLLLLSIGLAIGIPSALLLGRFVSSQLYGIEGNDPWTAATALVLMILVSSAAGLIPARRASRINPILALRYE